MLDTTSTPQFKLPNVRRLFIPDPGYMIFDADLKGADGQVVAWEANDVELKSWLAQGVDMHTRHAIEIGGEKLPPSGKLLPSIRQSYKHAVHGTHYGASAFALSRHPAIGWPLRKAEEWLYKYFQRRPGVKEWHTRTQFELSSKRTASNRFGYRILYFDRIDSLLPQALAWVPQSTVACATFKGALQLEKVCPWVEILIQVHDSIVFQVPFSHCDQIEKIREGLSVTVPYPEPLRMPWGLARSEKSWGECEKLEG